MNVFRTFGDKPCCYKDMLPYLSLLKPSEIDTFLNQVEENVDLDKEYPTSVNLYTYILLNLYQRHLIPRGISYPQFQ